MKAFTTSIVSIALALLYSQANASPAVAVKFLQNRQAQVVSAIIQIFGEVLKGASLAWPETVLAWDYNSNPNMCVIWMETTDGANCYAKVTCDDGVREYNEKKERWNVCFQGGRQFFTDPRIGEFSITFTTRDVGGDGLTSPVLQVADINNWMSLPVDDLVGHYNEYLHCKKHRGVGCDHGPYICTDYLSNNPYFGRTRKWLCGVPKRGQNFKGLDSNKPTNDRDYAPGLCGIHVTQYQKPDPSKDQYSFTARIMDSNQNEIGNSGGKQVGPIVVLTTKLPKTFTITGRAVDADPVGLGYDGATSDSNAPACSVGAYDSGKREMDCSFQCN